MTAKTAVQMTMKATTLNGSDKLTSDRWRKQSSISVFSWGRRCWQNLQWTSRLLHQLHGYLLSSTVVMSLQCCNTEHQQVLLTYSLIYSLLIYLLPHDAASILFYCQHSAAAQSAFLARQYNTLVPCRNCTIDPISTALNPTLLITHSFSDLSAL